MNHPQAPEWYLKAALKTKGGQSAAALEKGFEIVKSVPAPEPVVFVHDDMCEFKWRNSVIYVFGDGRKTIYIQHNGQEFVESSLLRLTFN